MLEEGGTADDPDTRRRWTGTLFDYNVPACAIIGAVAMLAAVSSKPFSSASARFRPSAIGGFALALRVLAVLYALVLIPLGLQVRRERDREDGWARGCGGRPTDGGTPFPRVATHREPRLQDMGSANMFSSLRMYGGSVRRRTRKCESTRRGRGGADPPSHAAQNHYMMQTGLLQKVFAHLPPESMVGEAFGGGIARIESTNASYLNGPYGVRYPGELLGHTPRTREYLVASGHCGRQFSPMSFACSIGNHPEITNTTNTGTMDHQRAQNDGINDHGKSNYDWNEGGGDMDFDRWSIPVPELRNRLLIQARDRFPDESFEVLGSLLPGVEGDEDWRATASAAAFLIRRSVDADGAESISCVDPASGAPCAPWVSAQLLTPPTGRWLPSLVRKLLLSQPYPFGTADGTRRLICFGP